MNIHQVLRNHLLFSFGFFVYLFGYYLNHIARSRITSTVVDLLVVTQGIDLRCAEATFIDGCAHI